MDALWYTPLEARRGVPRRALSLLELTAVVAVAGILAIAGIATFGHRTLSNGAAEGYARKLSLALTHARRATISTGDNHFVQFSPASGTITSFTIVRRASGGDVQVEQTHEVPSDVTISSVSRSLEFDFDGTALAGYSVDISASDRSWNVSVTQLTGSIGVTETTP